MRECIGEEGHKLFIEEGDDTSEADEEGVSFRRVDDSIEEMNLGEEDSNSGYSNQSLSFVDDEFEDDVAGIPVDSRNEI